MYQGILIGLTGPSGVGKGFVKDHLKSLYPDFVELSVITTRKRRPTDGVDRETDVPVALFFDRRDRGEIIFAHQPFVVAGDWYGFQEEQITEYLEVGRRILTEVHVDNAEAFQIRFSDRIALFGLVAEETYLRDNLFRRNTEDLEGTEIRLRQSMIEIEKIHKLHALGIFTDLISVSYENRQFVHKIVGEKIASVFREKDYHGRGSKERG